MKLLLLLFGRAHQQIVENMVVPGVKSHSSSTRFKVLNQSKGHLFATLTYITSHFCLLTPNGPFPAGTSQ